MLITGRQCKTARGLLKWNVRELEFRSTIRAKNIEAFEKGTLFLPSGHRELIHKALQAEGIVILEIGEVVLETTKQSKSNHGNKKTNKQSHVVYHVDADQLLGLNDAYYRQRKKMQFDDRDSPTLD